MSPPSRSTYRTIVLEEVAEEFVNEQNQVKNSRFEDQWRGVEWILARSPEEGETCGPENPGKFLVYVFTENQYAETRSVSVLYSYDENQVTIYSVRQEA